MKKICIISNSNLGTFLRYSEIFTNKNINFLVISSKKFIIEDTKNLKFHFVDSKNNNKFNSEAYKILTNFKPNKIILFYTKKIYKKIYQNYQTINIHNSLLPYYKGLNALKKSFKDENKFICSTSHQVNEKFDSGKIIHQIITPVKKKNLNFFKKTAFFQRIILLYAIIGSKKNNDFSLINGETIISPGLSKKKINFKFWK
tara:strand:- start:1067 stop:1669 length:603 start_codon:yes stop_codon:yes gene_type:complete